jgi:hypothetical protein
MKNDLRTLHQETPSTAQRSYILRLWNTDPSGIAGWRALLEDPRTGERVGFASLELLFAYLMELPPPKE